MGHNLSREEAAAVFAIGRHRYDRLRNLNPTLPIPRRSNYQRIGIEQKELVRLFLKVQPTEPGYPCQHRSTPVYMEDPEVTFASLYKDYIEECDTREKPRLSRSSFIRTVKFLMPTLRLGRTKTDVCNACFSLDLQIQNPETSDVLREELRAAKEVHLEEAIVQRKAINKLVQSVKADVAPQDPPLREEPVYIPECVKDPFDRVNRPLVVDVAEGTPGLEEGDSNANNLENYQHEENLNDEEGENVQNVENEEPDENDVRRNLRVSIQDFGAGIRAR